MSMQLETHTPSSGGLPVNSGPPTWSPQEKSMNLDAAAVQAMGLAPHELASIAGKYGVLSTDSGQVDVRSGSDGDSLTMTGRSAPEQAGSVP